MKTRLIKLILILGLLAVIVGGVYLGISKLLGPRQKLTTYTLPYVQNFDDVNLRNWFTKGGVWTLREQSLAQTVGGDEPGQVHISLKLPEDTPYHASVYLTIRKDTKAAGLAFNSQYPDLTEKQHRVYIAQPQKDTLELVSGYMDETGSFIPQAQIPISLNTSDFRLDLFVYENTYLVQLNGQRIIDKRPLFYNDGMLGFYTVGPAAFDNFKLSAADSRDPGDLVYTSDFDQDPGGSGWVPFGGDWRIADGQMTQFDPSAYAAGIGYETSTFQNFVLETSFQHLEGAGAGVVFNMPSPYQVNGAQVVRFSDEADALIWGYFDPKGIFNRQGYADVPAPGKTQHTLKIFSGETSYDIFLDDQMLARDVPLQTSRGAIGLFTSQASAAYSSVAVFPLFGSNAATPQPLTPIAIPPATTAIPVLPTPAPPKSLPPATAAPPANAGTPGQAATGANYQANFSGDMAASGWRVLVGDWAFSGGNLVQSNPNGVDMSIIYTPASFTNYTLDVGLAHLQGFGAGVLFNLPYSDRLNGAYLVRYSDRRPDAIFWGHYDEQGSFVGDGYANVPEASTDRHLLRIVSKAASYDIYLDGNLIVRDLPLLQNYGRIGLLTSNASAVYDTVSINGESAAAGEATGGAVTTGDAFSDVRVLSGKWDTNGSDITQQVTDLGDYVLNSGVYAREYTIEATIRMPNGGETGGGFIFHMPDRGSRNGAYLVRLINGGQGIFWGYYDDAGRFQGMGGAKLTPAEAYHLKLVVTGDLADISVNDQLIIENLKLGRPEGWLGLLSHGGVVNFTDVNATISGIGTTP